MSGLWQIPVLVYHHIHPRIDRYTNTPPDLFARQLRWIAGHYRFWTARDALDAHQRGESSEGRVVLTFDDGYEDAFLHARPILAQFGIRASFFILPNYAGDSNTWNRTCGYRAQHLSWDQIAMLMADGHEIGSHSMSHVRLDAVDPPTAAAEMRDAQRQILAHTGSAPASFAYPYGVFTSELTRIAARFYDVAFSTVKSTHRDWRADRLAIRRFYLPQGAGERDVLSLVELEAVA